jgi:hypothetical protein
MNQMVSNDDDTSADVPVWRKITAFFVLGSIPIIGGLLFALLVTILGVLLVYGLDNAAQ